MNKTNISYIDYSWNPLKMTCTPVSSGCKNCWHLAINKRFGKDYPTPILNEEELYAPLKLKKPSRIGVQFIGDLFHEDIPMKYLYKLFGYTHMTPHHEFFILTKRPQIMMDRYKTLLDYLNISQHRMNHLWLGVSAEDQETWDDRVPQLLEIDHPNKFVSIEPLLDMMDFHRKYIYGVIPSWVIVGGESGVGYRECKIEWIKDIVDQCKRWNVPCYVKQDSGPRPGMQGRILDEVWKIKEMP